MSILIIRIKKNRDGTAVLSCTRADGSVTWQKQEGGQARFFPRHDLTHYAVETVLRYRRGFFGLVAEGWSFSDFGTPWPRGPLPADADPAELIAGLLDAERANATEWPAAEMNAQAAQFYARLGLPGRLELTDPQLARIRETMRELFVRWEALPPGETLELTFEVPELAIQ
ncbi:MAG: hypothetical protein ACREOO_05960 [bacterium]